MTKFKQKLLLVDDQKEIRTILMQKLSVQEDLLITEASCVEEAIRIISNEKVDIIVSDLCMEPIDGLSFFSYIKENCIDIPFILFSGSEFELPIMGEPFIEYVKKPNFSRVTQLINSRVYLKSAV